MQRIIISIQETRRKKETLTNGPNDTSRVVWARYSHRWFATFASAVSGATGAAGGAINIWVVVGVDVAVDFVIDGVVVDMV